MGFASFVLVLFTYLLLHFTPSNSHPLCTDSTAPFTQTTSLSFCPYNGTVCCDSKQDFRLRKKFQAMNISDPGCASLVKSVICAKCDPYSAELFQVNPTPQPVPLLCNSTITSSASRAIQQTTDDFCSKVWDTCQNVSIMNSPFAVSLQGQTGQPVTSKFTKITDFWQSKTVFCNSLGGGSTDDSVCFDGAPVKLNMAGIVTPPNGMCLEKIGNGSYLNMAPHPDGSPRAFFANQEGKIWLATIPEEGLGGTLGLDETSPFLDLSDEVHFDTEFGMMGIAFHPNFAQNGRFFTSFNCDSKLPGCAGRCACNSDVNCDPSKLGTDNGAAPCKYQSVVAEFTANGSASQPSLAKSSKPIEVRRVFTMGLPFTSHHAGQILFGPTDGYLYFMMGDGGNTGDPYNFAQKKQSLLGKVMRLDVDTNPSAAEITKLGLWGNYSIPKDNPYTQDKDLRPEIWASGLRNPWRCSFDSERPSYFMCADVGQDGYEEVDMITKNGNFGWRVYEGPDLFKPQQTPGGNTSANSIRSIPPVLGYNHSEVNKNEGSASITGGYFYRSKTDPCLSGRYLYADLYAKAIWAGTESPENSGKFTTNRIPFSCASDSPINCTTVPGTSDPSLGYIFSFGEDNKKDNYLLASSGVYRIVRPSRCNYTCAKENATSGLSTGPASSPSRGNLVGPYKNTMLVCLSMLSLLLSLF